MGNHDIDCAFCRRDQRVYGDRCCEEFIRDTNIKRENREAERNDLRRFVKEIDPKVCILARDHFDTMYLSDVVKLLKKAQNIAAMEKP